MPRNESCPALTLIPLLNTWQLHLPVCATSTLLPSRPLYAKRRDRPEPFSASLRRLCAAVPQTCSVGKTAVVSMRVPAVAGVAGPSSATAQPPSEKGASRPPGGGRRAERRPRSELPHTAPVTQGHLAPRKGRDGRHTEPAGPRGCPAGALGVRGRQSRASPAGRAWKTPGKPRNEAVAGGDKDVMPSCSLENTHQD